MKLSQLWPTIILLSAIAACIVAFMMPGTLVALVIILWFLFMCPGMAVVRFIRLNETIVEWTLAVALGLSIDAIVAGVFLYGHIWSPPAILITLVVFSTAGAIGQLVVIRPGYMVQEETIEQLETVEISAFMRLLEQEETHEVVSVARSARKEAIEEKATTKLITPTVVSHKEHIEDQETRVVSRMPVAQERKVAIEEKETSTLPSAEPKQQPEERKVAIEEKETSMLPSAGPVRQSDERKVAIEEKETSMLPSAGPVRRPEERKEEIAEKETSTLPLSKDAEYKQSAIEEKAKEMSPIVAAVPSGRAVGRLRPVRYKRIEPEQ